MDIFAIFSMIGGLALFLYGMHVMGDGLSKTSGGRLEVVLEKLTARPLKAVLLGAGVTAVIQSSSATTVMVVGFVNSGIMRLSQAIGIIMGANIGTTATAWVLTLSGIEGDNFFVQLCKPSSFAPLLAIIGVVMIMFTKKDKFKNIGGILIGFAVLMTGMEAMSAAVKPLQDVPAFTNLLTMFSNPILGILAGAALTAIIQSSSASVGILQALCATGAITFSSAIPIILGQNIGTCVTAMISSIGANKNAKRAAIVHLYFNIIGTTTFMLAFYGLNAVLKFDFLTDTVSSSNIATVHTIFNIVATLTLLPFSRLLEKLAYLTIKENADDKVKLTATDEDLNRLDLRFLETPGFAVDQCKSVATNMAEMSKEAMLLAMSLVHDYDESKAKKVREYEINIDRYEDELGTYLIKLSQRQLNEKESHIVSVILHSLSDFERISDHAVNVMFVAKQLKEKSLTFSENSNKELEVLESAVEKIVDMMLDIFATNDTSLVSSIEAMEEVIDNLNTRIKHRHIQRLQEASCTVEAGLMLTDVCTHLERVSDHCSNVAACVVQVQDDALESHEYLHSIRSKNNREFEENLGKLQSVYVLPVRNVK